MADFAGGNGTENDPYLIETGEQFKNMANNLGTFTCYKQIADIDFQNETLTPIGKFDEGNRFIGSYNGDDYKISNVYIDTAEQANDNRPKNGVFGYVRNRDKDDNFYPLEFTNIIFDNITIDNYGAAGADRSEAGILMAHLSPYNEMVEIKNIEIKNSEINITGSSGSFPAAGALIGGSYAYSPIEIDNCHIELVINCYGYNVDDIGGLIGYMWRYERWNDEPGANVTISNCSTDLEMKKMTEDIEYEELVGGFIGYVGDAARDDEQEFVIQDCYSKANVFGSRVVGGFIGAYDTYRDECIAIIERCYSIADVQVTTGWDAAGVFAGALSTWGSEPSDEIIVRNCYAIGTLSAYSDTDNVAGFVGGQPWGGPVTYKNCYSAVEFVDIEADKEEVFGFIPDNDDEEWGWYIVENCYWNKDLALEEDVSDGENGYPRTIEKMTDPHDESTTYIDWNFDDIWYIADDYNDGYPVLLSLLDMLSLEISAYGTEGNGENLIDVIVENEIIERIDVNKTVSFQVQPDQEVRLKTNPSDVNPFSGWKRETDNQEK